METQTGRRLWQQLREQLLPRSSSPEEMEQDDLELWLGCYKKDLAAHESSRVPVQLRILSSSRSSARRN